MTASITRVRCSGSRQWMPGASGSATCPVCGQIVPITVVSELRVHHVGSRPRELKAVARRTRPAPRLLREIAEKVNRKPQAFLVELLEQHPTNEEAARSIGVTRNTLWRWCVRLGVGVERVDEWEGV